MSNNKSMPVLFIGHGSPMNAIEDNVFSQPGWRSRSLFLLDVPSCVFLPTGKRMAH